MSLTKRNNEQALVEMEMKDGQIREIKQYTPEELQKLRKMHTILHDYYITHPAEYDRELLDLIFKLL